MEKVGSWEDDLVGIGGLVIWVLMHLILLIYVAFWAMPAEDKKLTEIMEKEDLELDQMLFTSNEKSETTSQGTTFFGRGSIQHAAHRHAVVHFQGEQLCGMFECYDYFGEGR